MAGDICEMQVSGAREFNAMLSRLERKVTNKIAKDICKKAMQPMLATAQANAAALGSGRMSQLLSKKLKIYLIKKRNLRRGHFGAKISFQPKVAEFMGFSSGARSSLKTKKTTGKRYYIPHAIEYGHAYPGRGGGKGSPKDVAARPFIRPAFDRKKDAVASYAELLVRDFIDSQENH